MELCTYCLNKIILNNFEYHKSICIYYIYNTYISTQDCNNHTNKKLSNQDIQNISMLITLFNLHKDIKYKLFDSKKIINTLILKNKINYQIIINELINYLLNLNTEFFSFDDLLLIIETITKHSKNDIINVIKSYKICYNNL